MEKIKIGKSDLAVSRIGIGTWQASGWVNSDEHTLISVIRKAYDLGINFIDTAESYGDGYSEQVVQKAIESNRHNYIIATKFSHKNAEPEKLRKAIESSLRRLKTDYIDLYQYHWPSPTIPLNETIDQLTLLKKEGKIRAIGVSNWMEPEFEKFNDLITIDSVQNCYNLLWRSVEKTVLPLCINNQISFLAYSPLAQGVLSGKFDDPDTLPPDPRRQNVLLKPPKFELVRKILIDLEDMSSKYGCLMSQLALAWLMHKEGVGSIIIGNSSLEQLNTNLIGAFIKIEQSDITRLDDLSDSLSNTLEPHDTLWGWHSCKNISK